MWVFLTASFAAPLWPDLAVPIVESDGSADVALVVADPRLPGAVKNAGDWVRYFDERREVPRVVALLDGEVLIDAIDHAVGQVQPGGTFWYVQIGRDAEVPEVSRLDPGPHASAVAFLDTKETPLFPPNSRVTVLSAGSGDSVGPLPGLDRPAFSYLALGAMQGWADDDRDSAVTAFEVLAYAQDALWLVVTDRRQRPTMFGPDRVVSRDQADGPALSEVALALRMLPKENGLELDALRGSCDGGDDVACTELAKRLIDVDEDAALRTYEETCNTADSPACWSLGVEDQSGAVLHLVEVACERHIPRGCTDLGHRYAHGGRGVPKDITTAISLYQRACELGGSSGCTALADRYRTGEGVDRHYQRALKVFWVACAAGSAVACRKLGAAEEVLLTCEQGSRAPACDLEGPDAKVYRDVYQERLEMRLPHCEEGEAAHCYRLEELTRFAPDRPRFEQLAHDVYVDACKGGDQRACTYLGRHYETGVPGRVTPNPKKAVKLYERGCDEGIGLACTLLGDHYRASWEVPGHPEAAWSSYEKACELGTTSGCVGLGRILSSWDEARAYSYFRKACSADPVDHAGCVGLGTLEIRGAMNLPPEREKALERYWKACVHREIWGCEELQRQ